MPDTLTAEQIRQIIRDEIPKRRNRDQPLTRRRTMLQCAMAPDEMAAVRAEALARGLCLADLVRLALEPIINRELPRNRLIPVNLQKRTRDMSKPELVDAMRRGIVASRILAQSGAAVRETASVPVPKLRGPQRPE